MPLRIVLLACTILFCGEPLLAGTPRNHPVKIADLQALIERADTVVVYAIRLSDSKIVYSSSDPKDLAALREAITIEPPDGELRCLCLPSTQIRLFRKDKELGTIVIYPDGLTIGFSRWSSDARILDNEKWLQWFDARKISGPRAGFEEAEAIEKRDRAYEERWISAMPVSLRPIWPKVSEAMFPGQEMKTTELDVELAKEYTEANQRILVLMSWFGSGAGPWSGYPSYEGVAEKMLLEYRTAELLAALQGATLSERQQEGAARLFAGWEFNQQRPEDNRLISADLKRMLLDHSVKSADQDKVGRARKAFEQN